MTISAIGSIYDKARYIKIHDLIKAILREPFKGVASQNRLREHSRGIGPDGSMSRTDWSIE